MLDFTYANPTRILFGRGVESHVGRQILSFGGSRVLLHYGGGSIKKSGLYDRVLEALKEADLTVVELPGAQPNPRLQLVKEGIALCRRENVDFVLAVGGGSAIDSSKAIAAGVRYPGDVWDLFSGKAPLTDPLPVGVVLTIPAAGSESSTDSVVTQEEGMLKRALKSELIRPRFAIMNPELTFTLPREQTLYGAADIMAHVIERYFTPTKEVDLTDRLCEAVLLSVIANLPRVLEDPNDYDARAQIMWAGSIAHNNLLSTGRVGDWASHALEHELSASYDVAHGAGLAVIMPAWMNYVYHQDVARFAQFASRVWGVSVDATHMDMAAREGIGRMRDFFVRMGLPVTLRELSIGEDQLAFMAHKCATTRGGSIGQFMVLREEDMVAIYRAAL
jgi:alcohol dehydrogenase YqhD (iron-dependent ADH family)